jgi:mevalonate kinase
MTQSLTARAPAKIIISGEHSVLYGQAAIAIAVDRYTTTKATLRADQLITFDFVDLPYKGKHDYTTLKARAKNLEKKYLDYLNGHFAIREVLSQPFDLLQYTVSKIIDRLNLQTPIGFEFSVSSDIPIGCGMGSSASSIMGAVYALSNFFYLNMHTEDYLLIGRELENLQHGKSSGLDLYLVTHGGCAKFQNGVAEPRQIPDLPLYIVDTGKPESSTGDCVSFAATKFAENEYLVKQFGAVTERVDQALVANKMNDFKQAIKDNHQLLCAIGVVPEKVKNFIQEIEQHGGVAKISGSGAVFGERAGVVLLACEQNISHILNKYKYQLQSIQVDYDGTQII